MVEHPVIETLRQAVEDFCHYIEHLDALVEKAWGPKEVLAHLIFWQASYVQQLEAILAQQPPHPPEGTFDAINARVVELSRGIPKAVLLDRYRAVNVHFSHLGQSVDMDGIVLQLKKGSEYRRSVKDMFLAEADHIRDHLRILEAQARHDYLSDIANLRQVVDVFCQTLREQQVASAKSTLAYLTLYQENYVQQIETICNNQPLDHLRGQRSALNQAASGLDRMTAIDDLILRFQQATERLCAFAETLDVQAILIEKHYDKFSHVYTLDHAIERVATQIYHLHEKLKRAGD